MHNFPYISTHSTACNKDTISQWQWNYKKLPNMMCNTYNRNVQHWCLSQRPNRYRTYYWGKKRFYRWCPSYNNNTTQVEDYNSMLTWIQEDFTIHQRGQVSAEIAPVLDISLTNHNDPWYDTRKWIFFH